MNKKWIKVQVDWVCECGTEMSHKDTFLSSDSKEEQGYKNDDTICPDCGKRYEIDIGFWKKEKSP